MLVDISDRKRAEEHAYRLAAIVASSDDAIVSKDLNGTITSWNAGAERLFGYSAEDVIGKPITISIPPERLHEEPVILARVRRGEAIEHYETVRRRKDGSLVHISLTVSPIKSAEGRIIGVSKIARDITERQRAEERQNLLIREMAHRVKNLFAVAGGLVALSARTAKDPAELAAAVRDRLAALSRAHSLTLPAIGQDVTVAQRSTTLHLLVREILHPYDDGADERSPRVAIEGADAVLASSVVTSIALVLHELATNAVKYGSLSAPGGSVYITCSEEDEQLVLVWKERGGPPVQAPGTEGFGTRLGRATIERQLRGAIEWEWNPEGLMIRLRLPTDVLAA